VIKATFSHLGPKDGDCDLVFAISREEKIRDLDVAVEIFVVAELNIQGVRHNQVGNTHLSDCKDVAGLR